MVCCPQACRPETRGTWRSMMLTLIYLTTKQSEECPWTDHTLFGQFIQNFSLSFPNGGQTHSFESISQLWPLCLAKKQSSSFPLHPKLLRFNLALVYGNWILPINTTIILNPPVIGDLEDQAWWGECFPHLVINTHLESVRCSPALIPETRKHQDFLFKLPRSF